MKLSKAIFPVLFVLALACKSGDSETKNTKGNPPAQGFNLAASDPAAVELADSVMSAMGGRANWDDTNFISWTADNGREIFWDKNNERVRINSPAEKTIYLLKTTTGEGMVQINSREIKNADSLNVLLQRASALWEDDAYALLMPFNLKGTGLTLKYLGEDLLKDGGKCNVLELTRDGDVSGKRQRVFVDLDDNLVKQWAQLSKTEKDTADVVRAWDNYKLYGRILLSADRSDGSGPKDVKVVPELPEKLFTEF